MNLNFFTNLLRNRRLVESSKPPVVPISKKITLVLQRYSDDGNSTLGILMLNNKFLCYTLEDEYREVKLKGETRIPAGRYKITLRTEGTFHAKYSSRFAKIHKGMLWIRDVPNFEYILIHCGNKQEDTAGCILVGNTSIANIDGKEGFIGESTEAYRRVYPMIANAMAVGAECEIVIFDEHRL